MISALWTMKLHSPAAVVKMQEHFEYQTQSFGRES